MRSVKVGKRNYIFKYGKLEKVRCLRCGVWVKIKPENKNSQVECGKCGLLMMIDEERFKICVRKSASTK